MSGHFDHNYSLVVDTVPQAEPVSQAELKTHFRVDWDDTEEDAYIVTCGKAARRAVERRLKRRLIDTVLTLKLDRFPPGDIILVPYPPLSAVAHLKYTDAGGTVQSLVENTDFVKDTATSPGRVMAAYGTSWPSTRAYKNVVELKFTAGYGTEGDDVPADILAALKILAADMYENREKHITELRVQELTIVENLLFTYRDRTVY